MVERLLAVEADVPKDVLAERARQLVTQLELVLRLAEADLTRAEQRALIAVGGREAVDPSVARRLPQRDDLVEAISVPRLRLPVDGSFDTTLRLSLLPNANSERRPTARSRCTPAW